MKSLSRSRVRGVATLALLPSLVLIACPATAQDSAPTPLAGETGPGSPGLTLETAIRRTLAASPLSAVASARRDSLSAAREIAGVKPQPSVDVSVENFGPPMGGLYDQFQVTGTYSQRIERGGKRQARVSVASRDLDIAEAEAIIARLDLIRTVQQGFVEVQAAEAAIAVARDRVRIASELEREVSGRVASARDPIFAGTRARTGAAEARVDLELAIHARDAAAKRLASLWGGSPESSAATVTDFLNLQPADASAVPSLADLALLEARISRGAAAVDLQKANAARDPTISGGPRIIGTSAVGFVAGVSIPLGGKKAAQARIAEAQAETRRAAAQLAVERYNLERAIALAAEQAEESRKEALAIRTDVFPSAERTLEQVRTGYNRGFFSFADVSAAQTILTNARSRIVEATRRHHQARVELDRLTGRFTDLAREGIQ
jgi:outer membrane protein, heavy metal efflux system